MTFIFITSLLVFLSVGLYSARYRQKTSDDYYLASRSIPPWLMSVSTGATLFSGFQFTGVMAFTYNMGVSAIWFTICAFIGNYIAWKWIYKPYRLKNNEVKARTVSEYVAYDPKIGTRRLPVVIGGLITLCFLSVYASAQLAAGSKALYVVFGWDYWVGGLISFFIVGSYCLAGGLRASIWTDAIQAIVMIVAMYLLLIYGLDLVGGFSGLWNGLSKIDPNLVKLIPDNLKFGFIPFFIAWVAFGICALCTPHLLIRNKSINSHEGIKKAAKIYFVWAIPFKFAGFFVGLLCRVILSPETDFDAELSLLLLSEQILPLVLVGVILAGLFASTISTADSLILSSAAALTCDLFPKFSKSYSIVKLGTFIVLTVVLLMMFFASKNVFELVVLSISALGCTFVPGILAQILSIQISSKAIILSMLTGNVTLFLWKYYFAYSADVKEVLPGLIVGLLTMYIVNLFEKKANC